MVILDTNIIIDHLRLVSQNQKISFLRQLVKKQSQAEISLSVITLQDLYGGQSTRKKARKAELRQAIAPLTILPYDQQVATLAGQITRDSREKRSFADAAIAATAIIHQAELFTLNTKHFENIPQLKLFNLES